MIIHLGNGYFIDEKKILGIFDLENTTSGQITREFLKKESSTGNIIDISDDIPKSFVVTENGTYLCQLSVKTLKLRYNII